MSSNSARPRRKQRPAEPLLHPACDPAVRDLLDHIARELAEEYVRLMQAEDAPSAEPAPSRREAR